MRKWSVILLCLLCSQLLQAQFRADTLLSQRQQKDLLFKNGPGSPVPEKQRKKFKGLTYYQPDPAYHVKARYHRYPVPEKIIFKTSDTREPEYYKEGYFTFTLNDSLCTLQVYRNLELAKKPGLENYLFLPFADLTNGETTYPSGRYLEVYLKDEKTYFIDFNKAYNPYCAYSGRYSCPIPPAENFLNLMVEAGEKYHAGKKK